MITVTGATGQLGQLVVKGLLERVPADQITAAVRNPQKASALADRGVRVRYADYADPDTLPGALDGTDRLLLISGNEPGRSLIQHTAVIDAATQVQVGLLAFTSLTHPAGPPRATEPVIQASGLPYTLLRNGLYTEHYTPQIQQALATGTFVGSAGNGRVATATHADLAAATVEVLTGSGHENAIYELTGDEAWNFPELVAEISNASGKTIAYRDIPSAEHLELLVSSGVPRMYADVFVATYTAIANGEYAATTADLRTLIGRPTTTLAESVAKIINPDLIN